MLRNPVIRCFVFVLLLITVTTFDLIGLSCSYPITSEDYNHSQIQYHSRYYAFDYLRWELNAVKSLVNSISFESAVPVKEEKLGKNITSVLKQHGITVFPPVNFKIESPPYLHQLNSR